jgi:transposase InsO family protein
MMCKLMKVSKSAYYAWKSNNADRRRAPGRDVLKAEVKRRFEESGGVMGGWSIWSRMVKDGYKLSLWLVRKLMKELEITAAPKKKRFKTTIADPDAPYRPDLLKRDFTSPVPTIKLASDITYLRLDATTTLYLAVVIDLCTRMVVGWEIATHMRASLVVDALKMAWRNGYVAQGAIFHSDRGSQYTSKLLRRFADAINVRLSCGRKATCFDNAVAESFFATLKKQWYHRHRFDSAEEMRASLAQYIELYYNRQRPHSTLGGNTPAEEYEMHVMGRQDIMRKAA